MNNVIIPLRVTADSGWPADVLRYQRDVIDPDAPGFLIIGPAVSEERLRRGYAALGLDPGETVMAPAAAT